MDNEGKYIVCNKCGRSYTRGNKFHHMNSAIHKRNSNDPSDLESYIDDIKRKYDDKIGKVSKEKIAALREIDKQIAILS